MLESGEPNAASVGGVHALAHPLRAGDAARRRRPAADHRAGLGRARGARRSASRERELFHYLAGQASVSVENVGLHETVERQAVTDELTGLSNRRRFQETSLNSEVERSRRFGQHVGLVMLDIDDFKTVNDTYGHQAGDVVLREVARVLRASSREIDEPARYGGEELAVVLPGTDLEGAYNLAERVRVGIERLELPVFRGDGVAPAGDRELRRRDAAVVSARRPRAGRRGRRGALRGQACGQEPHGARQRGPDGVASASGVSFSPMGLLDDAIREHLELKRRRGEDAAEIARLEHDAFGPIRGRDDNGEDAEEHAPQPAAHESPVATEPEPSPRSRPLRTSRTWTTSRAPRTRRASSPSTTRSPSPTSSRSLRASARRPSRWPRCPSPSRSRPSPSRCRPSRRRCPSPRRCRPSEPPAEAPGPLPDAPEPPAARRPAGDRRVLARRGGGRRAPEATDEPPDPDTVAADEEHDELEETPEFLQETPEHDRLWFEQKPPRDFDF